ncbi:ADP-ribosylation factor-like protein 2-binding protein [Neocloeon triangulifer]|uniref:ADP-ribosylation factor-like protein 2-binding protein n=1 Tax=Neocloeon triangulifer TaxID=2078957 RepID=UPI00286F297C|nr:ADP-ribosylation factor-like protein 2-binding protein [Neocloeon triangulifer]
MSLRNINGEKNSSHDEKGLRNGEDFSETLELNVSMGSMLFDTTIGHIEDIIMDPNFQILRETFMDQNCVHFEDNEENKLIYMDIFQEYIRSIEDHLKNELLRRIPDFNMTIFLNELQSQRYELEGEVFEMLLSFGDFLTFKQIMLDHKSAKMSTSPSLIIQASSPY